ncbi:hypothetical protein HG535_0G04830 [Zygotorulaspora mrakii]|uniref:Increased recombination centers protein 6 n=1 Tax=Zygotorulaspora mrakii TaxID=42260 RepID=A0A7H9B7T4_ZYGMR|nr:uncharacterized protein HG535_0G04830 [Zygotorulaspora mrakii]QLG74600.1 hypothetical protein HG535_0G04830 [Zygotorulaspora mrakii]
MLKERSQEVTKFPRNKILVAFSKYEKHEKEVVLKSVFGELSKDTFGNEQKILKGLTWKTKYYTLVYDLYIDEYESLKDWLADLKSDEYIELRDVLAGIMVFDKFTDTLQFQDISQILETPELEKCFKICCNVDKHADGLGMSKINDEFAQRLTTLEVVNWSTCDELDEYGEKNGKARIKEIIDTHDWSACSVPLELANSNDIPAGDTEAEDDLNIEVILRKLQQARLRFASQELDEKDASTLAEEVAGEIMKYV